MGIPTYLISYPGAAVILRRPITSISSSLLRSRPTEWLMATQLPVKAGKLSCISGVCEDRHTCSA
ncbi:hypothetical protein LIA77_06711 [Sarocladium implicatum]|nr:hypothetical protein LIA77_06711 [Sarocladium implicatum]